MKPYKLPYVPETAKYNCPYFTEGYAVVQSGDIFETRTQAS